MPNKLTWEEWHIILRKVCENFNVPEVADNDPEVWRDAYEDDISPRDALTEEMSYWGD